MTSGELCLHAIVLQTAQCALVHEFMHAVSGLYLQFSFHSVEAFSWAGYICTVQLIWSQIISLISYLDLNDLCWNLTTVIPATNHNVLLLGKSQWSSHVMIFCLGGPSFRSILNILVHSLNVKDYSTVVQCLQIISNSNPGFSSDDMVIAHGGIHTTRWWWGFLTGDTSALEQPPPRIWTGPNSHPDPIP